MEIIGGIVLLGILLVQDYSKERKTKEDAFRRSGAHKIITYEQFKRRIEK